MKNKVAEATMNRALSKQEFSNLMSEFMSTEQLQKYLREQLTMTERLEYSKAQDELGLIEIDLRRGSHFDPKLVR